MSFQRAALVGAKWTSASSIVSAVAQFAQITVLAWLLRPADFGLMAMVMIVLSLAQIYADLGISFAIVQKQDSSSEQLSSLYWLGIAMGIAIFVLLCAGTPIIVSLYGEPRLATIVPLISLLFLIAPIGSQFGLLLQKNLEFKTIALIEMSAVTCGAIIAIAAAYNNFGVYSFVLGQLGASIVSAVWLLTIGTSRWRPSLHFRYADIKGYLGFGLYQIGERSFNLIGSRTDQFLIGILLGPEPLGYYSFAWNLIIQPVNRINPILTRVAFPFLSQLQNDTQRMRRGYLVLLKMLSTINAPVLLGISAVAPLLVPLIYGAKWQPAVLLVQLLAGVGLLRAMTNPSGTLLLAMGRADLGFIWGSGIVGVQVIGVSLSVYFFGTVGAAIGLLLLHIVYLSALYRFVVRELVGPCLGSYIGAIVPPAATAGVMALLVAAIPYILPVPAPLLLATQVLAGIVIYIGITVTTQPSWTAELRSHFGLKRGASES